MTVKKNIDNLIIPTVFNYLVKGDPTPLSKVTDDNGPKFWDTYKQSRLHYIQTIKNKHDTYFSGACFTEGANNPRQFVDGVIKLEATFYMRATPANKPGKMHMKKPPIFSLFNFLDHALQGVVYKKDITISSVKLEKVYDKNPRTVIKITRL